jgi:alkyl hydroperoxide reductase subunit AhpF
MKKEQLPKCKKKKQGFEFCEALDKAFDGNKLRIAQIGNFETHESFDRYVVLHAGEFKKKGVVLNYCPFCKGILRKGKKDEKRTVA